MKYLILTRSAQVSAYLISILLITCCDAGHMMDRLTRSVDRTAKTVPAEVLDGRQATTEIKLDTQAMLERGDFLAIEELADRARDGKQRLRGGYWKIDAIYDGLSHVYATSPGQMVSDSDWESRIAALTEWKQRSASVTPRVALAAAMIQYGWFARGSGTGNSVSAADSLRLSQRLKEAAQELFAIRSAGLSCPRWYREMLFVGMATRWQMSEIEEVYAEMLSAESNYLQGHIVMSDNLTPKWNGQPGDWRKFLDSIPDIVAKSGSDESDLVYFVIVANKLNDRSLRIDWPNLDKERLRNGYTQLENRYGVDNFRLNQFAYVSALVNDYESVRSTLAKIGNNRDQKVWDEHSFELARTMSQ